MSAKSSLQGRVALITGASSGIGADAARRLARAGAKVGLVARRGHRLEAVAEELSGMGAQVRAVPADLTDGSQREQAFAEVTQALGTVDVLVNNAGFGRYDTVERTPPDEAARMFDLNVLAIIDLCRLALPAMRAQSYGRVVNVGSIAGYIAAPPLTVYAATKFALVGLSEGLRRELEQTPGVHVTLVSPGPARTAFGQVASGMAISPRRVPGGLRPERVGAAIVSAVRRPRREVVVPAYYRPALRLSRMAPALADVGARGRDRAWRRHLREARAAQAAQ